MDDLYREVIIEHYKNPGYRGRLVPHDIQFEDNNPLCGDHIEITLRTDEEGKVSDARFDGHGCAISQASADLLMEFIVGKPIEEVKKLNKQDVLDMLGIDLGPVRLKCAMLSLQTAHKALADYKMRQLTGEGMPEHPAGHVHGPYCAH